MGEYLRRNKETIKWFRLVPLGQGYASNFWQSPEGQDISNHGRRNKNFRLKLFSFCREDGVVGRIEKFDSFFKGR